MKYENMRQLMAYEIFKNIENYDFEVYYIPNHEVVNGITYIQTFQRTNLYECNMYLVFENDKLVPSYYNSFVRINQNSGILKIKVNKPYLSHTCKYIDMDYYVNLSDTDVITSNTDMTKSTNDKDEITITTKTVDYFKPMADIPNFIQEAIRDINKYIPNIKHDDVNYLESL